MASTRFIFFIFSNIMLLVTTQSIDLQQPFVNHVCSNDKGNYTADSTYQKDLNTLLTVLLASSNNSNGYGFYNSTLGRDPNQVHAIGHCRGDISANDCSNCLNDSRVVLTELCPNQKEAIGWKDICMLRYSHRSIYGVMETDPNFTLFNAHNMTSLAPEFMKRLERLILSLRVQAASSGPLRKFSVGNTSIGASQTLYGFAQCTPDLSEKDCSDCLQGPFGTYTENGKVGCRVFRPSCNIQCETSSFIETANVVPLPSTSPVSPPEPSSTNTTAPGGSKGNKTRTVNPVVIIVVAATLVALIISISVFLGLRKRKRKLHKKLLPGVPAETSAVP